MNIDVFTKAAIDLVISLKGFSIPKNAELAYNKLCQAIAEAEKQEPVAWMFQHEETGRTTCVDAQQLEWGFEQGNPRLKKIAPLYTSSPQHHPLVWQPIETAPKDGTDVLVMYIHIDTQVVHNGFWMGADDTDEDLDIGWWSYEHSEVSRIKLDDWMTPTHWMPLPSIKGEA